METVKITVEVAGFLISDNGQDRILPARVSGKRKLFWGNTTWSGGSMPMDAAFEIESDDPEKLHKFTGLKYEGLFAAPPDVLDVISRFAKKFEGCTILYSSGDEAAIYGNKLHIVPKKRFIFESFYTTRSEGWKDVNMCKIIPTKNPANTAFVHRFASEIISEFTRIMNDEDNA